MARYAIWDKTSPIYTPVGEKLTPEQWISRYGWIDNPAAIPVVSGGIINGAFCGELSMMVENYTRVGVDFSTCTTNEEKLTLIEEYEDATIEVVEEISAEERIAAALEYQVMASLPDESEVTE